MGMNHRFREVDKRSPAGAGPAVLNALLVVLAVWLVISPLVLGYAATDAANDLFLWQIAAAILIGVSALPRVRRPDGHPHLVFVTLAAAALLLVVPWLLGASSDETAAGLPPGAADNGFAPTATANAIGTGLAVAAVTGAAALAPRRPPEGRANPAIRHSVGATSGRID